MGEAEIQTERRLWEEPRGVTTDRDDERSESETEISYLKRKQGPTEEVGPVVSPWAD